MRASTNASLSSPHHFSDRRWAPFEEYARPYHNVQQGTSRRSSSRRSSRFGDGLTQPLETIECRDWLDSAAIGKPGMRMVPRERRLSSRLAPNLEAKFDYVKIGD
jgi:hypothetical protein